MLPESHPLFDAQMFLLLWFEKAPPDQWVEFYVLADNKLPTKPPTLSKSKAEVCPVRTLERSFELTIAKWIQDREREQYHIYFGVCPRATVNRTEKGGFPTHAREEDITTAVGAWVDVDKLHWRSMIETEKPPATFIFSSGHGCQMFFKYAEPKAAAEAVADCQALMEHYGGDKCWDSPRVLRVPGTTNWKMDLKSGTKCTIHMANPDAVFFGIPKAAIPEQVRDNPADPATPISMEKIFERMGGDFELKNAIIGGHEIAQGYWPTDVKEDGNPDRSALDFYVMKRLGKIGFSEAEIHAVFHDSTLGISAKILEEEKKQGSDHNFDVTIRKVMAAVAAENNRYGIIGDEVRFETPQELAKAPKLDFAVDRIMPIGGFCVVSGAAKAGKSLAVTDLMLLLAGVPGKFLGHFDVHHFGPVAYCQAEITRPSLKNRLNTIGASRDVKWEDYPIHVFTGRFNLMDYKNVNAVIKGVQKAKARYFVLDPLARFHYGEENKHRDMMLALSGIEKIVHECELLGAFVVHHHGKPGEFEKTGVQQMRGSTVIGDWGNAHVILSKQWSQSTGKKFIRISMELRDAEEIDPFTLALDGTTMRHMPFTESDERFAMTMNVVNGVAGDRQKKIDIVCEQLKVRPGEAARLVDKAEAKQKFSGHPPKEIPFAPVVAAHDPEEEASLDDDETPTGPDGEPLPETGPDGEPLPETGPDGEPGTPAPLDPADGEKA